MIEHFGFKLRRQDIEGLVPIYSHLFDSVVVSAMDEAMVDMKEFHCHLLEDIKVAAEHDDLDLLRELADKLFTLKLDLDGLLNGRK